MGSAGERVVIGARLTGVAAFIVGVDVAFGAAETGLLERGVIDGLGSPGVREVGRTTFGAGSVLATFFVAALVGVADRELSLLDAELTYDSVRFKLLSADDALLDASDPAGILRIVVKSPSPAFFRSITSSGSPKSRYNPSDSCPAFSAALMAAFTLKEVVLLYS